MRGTTTAFSRIGGEPALRRLVKRFHELMETLPEGYGMRNRDEQPTA